MMLHVESSVKGSGAVNASDKGPFWLRLCQDMPFSQV